MPSATAVYEAFDALEREAARKKRATHARTHDRELAVAEWNHACRMKRALEPLVAEDTEQLAATLNLGEAA